MRPFLLLLVLSCAIPAGVSANTGIDRCGSSGESGGWKVLDSRCDIGTGLWGREPADPAGKFWLQCGVTNEPPAKWFAKLVKEKLPSQDAYLYKEENQYRCLAGPYDDYNNALKARDELRQHRQLKTAFIRQAGKSEKDIKAAEAVKTTLAKAKSKTEVKPEPVKSVEKPVITDVDDAVEKNVVAVKEVVKTEPLASPVVATTVAAEAAVMADKKEVAEAEGKPASVVAMKEPEVISDGGVRHYYAIGNVWNPQPAVDESRYREKDRYWLRASLEEARAACKQDGKRLITERVLNRMARNKVTAELLPKRLPFWTDEAKGFDIQMKVPLPVKPGSALNVLCM